MNDEINVAFLLHLCYNNMVFERIGHHRKFMKIFLPIHFAYHMKGKKMLDNSIIEDNTISVERLVENHILVDSILYNEFCSLLTTHYSERTRENTDFKYGGNLDWIWELWDDEDARLTLLHFLNGFFGGSTITSNLRLLDEIKYICNKSYEINQCLDADALVLISKRLKEFIDIGLKNGGAAPSTTKCEELV